MKKTFWAGISILLISAVLVGCGSAVTQAPAPVTGTFAGTWTTNLGTINFVQEGNTITGVIQGYGGNWNETFTGTIDANGEAAFDTQVLGGFSLVLDSEDTFKSTSSELSFCGIRGSQELPSGCGFSGKWIVPAKHVFLDGSYMILKQVGENVTGDLYDGNDKVYDSFTGKVNWGKGWMANGESKQRGELSLWMNAAETGFQFMYGNSGNSQELCAVRDGVSSAYLSSFTCEP